VIVGCSNKQEVKHLNSQGSGTEIRKTLDPASSGAPMKLKLFFNTVMYNFLNTVMSSRWWKPPYDIR
jgi:hypothetical protein